MNTNNTAYFYDEALIPRTFTVCGIEMKPFCLGHLILLERIKSPVLASDVTEVSIQQGLTDFFTALTICALTYEEGLQVLKDDEYSKKVMDVMIKAISNNMEAESKEWNIYHKTNMFKLYMTYFMEMPSYSVEQKNSHKTGLDWKIGIWQVFKKMGYSETDILNMNMRRLFYEWCQWGESEGGIKVMNSESLKPAEILIL